MKIVKYKIAQFWSDKTSFMIPLIMNNTTMLTIIDMGTGMSIISCDCWHLWGNLEMPPSNVKLLMTNGSTQSPKGMA